jgi:hypothetical protein
MCFDSEAPLFYFEEIRTFRKERLCCECGLPIRKGEQGLYSWGKWSSGFEAFRTCLTCVWFRERIAEQEKKNGCRGIETLPPFTLLLDSLQDGIGEKIGLVHLTVLEQRGKN